MSPSIRTVVADRGDAGVRLDRVVRRHLTDLPAATRTRVQAWIAGGQVTVNGAPVRRASARAALGDLVAVVVPDPALRRAMIAEPSPLAILFEDEHLLAVDKPAGLVVHPTFRHATGTLMNALLWHARGWPAGRRPSIVGRLDKLTSGIVLVAKTREVHAALQHGAGGDPEREVHAALRRGAVGDPEGIALHGERVGQHVGRPFQGRHTTKDYLAIVYGRVPARGAIDVGLALTARDRRRVVASAAGARSVTEFERLSRAPAPRAGLAMLRCRLITGRRHQIRVHLAARGWPIVGDPVYGEPLWMQIRDPMLAAALRAFPRQALHAHRLELTHPITGNRVRIEAPLPPDMQSLIVCTGLGS